MRFFYFPLVIIDEDFRSENTSGSGIRELAAAIEAEGMDVIGYTSYGDLTSFAQQQSRAAGFILSIDDEEFGGGSAEETQHALTSLRHFVEEIRRRNPDIPIYLYGETRTARHIPNDVLRELHGFIHMHEDTPEFVARHIIREARSYLDTLAPPFFRALTHYAQDGSYSWHCPGHSGGVAFLKSPVGQMFHQSLAKTCCAPTCVTPLTSWASCWITPARWLHQNAMPRAFFLMPTICSLLPTAPPHPTRLCGTAPWRPAISWWSTATATSPSCTPS